MIENKRVSDSIRDNPLSWSYENTGQAVKKGENLIFNFQPQHYATLQPHRMSGKTFNKFITKGKIMSVLKKYINAKLDEWMTP